MAFTNRNFSTVTAAGQKDARLERWYREVCEYAALASLPATVPHVELNQPAVCTLARRMDTNAMIKRISKIVLAIGLILAVVGCGHRRHTSISEQELVRRTQELMDAVAPGNQEPWKKYFADDATYF
jgi:hypothetical protein